MCCYGVDVVVFFSDIVILLCFVGVEVEIELGCGFVFVNLVCIVFDVDWIIVIDLVDLDGIVIVEVVWIVMIEFGDILLIGFVGVLFMFVVYFVEGGFFKEYLCV